MSKATRSKQAPFDGANVPAWISAALLGVTALVACRASRRSAREQRTARARLVYAASTDLRFLNEGDPWITGDLAASTTPEMTTIGDEPDTPHLRTEGVQLRVAVHNNSDEFVTESIVRIEDLDPKRSAILPVNFGLIPPRSMQEQFILFPDRHPYPDVGGRYEVRVAFRDTDGKWWERREGESVRRLKRAPRQ